MRTPVMVLAAAFVLFGAASAVYGQQASLDENGAGSLEWAQALNDWALQNQDSGKDDEAVQVLEHALAIREEKLGPEHPDTLTNLINLASLLTSMERYEEARPFYERVLVARDELLGSEHPESAESLLGLADRLHDTAELLMENELDQSLRLREFALAVAGKVLGPQNERVRAGRNVLAFQIEGEAKRLESRNQYDSAEARYAQAIAVMEKTDPPPCNAWPSLIRSIDDLARMLWRRGRYEEARQHYERSLTLTQTSCGPDAEDVATSLDNLATVLTNLGRYDEAEALLERALDIRVSRLGADDPETAAILDAMAGLVHQPQGRFDKARRLFEQALGIREKEFGPEATETARSLSNLGHLYLAEGRHDKARPFFERALAINEKALPQEQGNTAMSLGALGNLLRNDGLYGEAKPLVERALAITEQELGPEHPETAASLHNLGILYQEQGQYARARPLFERALTIREMVLGPEHPLTALTLDALAGLLFAQNQFEEALALNVRALEIRIQGQGPLDEAAMSSLHLLAALVGYAGQQEVARRLYEALLAASEERNGPAHRYTADCLNNLANWHLAQGQYDEARALYERALSIMERVAGTEHPSTAQKLGNVGMLQHFEGRSDEALLSLRRALNIQEKKLGPLHPEAAISRSSLAIVLAELGKTDAAWYLLRSARQGRDAHLQRTLAALSENEAMLFMQSQRWQQTVALSLAGLIDEPTVWKEAYEEQLAWKGRVTRLAQQSRAHIVDDLTDKQKMLIADLRTVQGEMSTLVNSENVADRAAHTKRLDELRNRRNALEVQWQRDSEAVEQAPVTFERFRAALPDGSAVVDFLVQGVWTPAGVERGETNGDSVPRSRQESYELMESDPHLMVWITQRNDQTPMRLDLGRAATIEVAVQAFLEHLVTPGNSTRTSPDANGELRKLIWDPIATYLGPDIDLVFISPDSFVGTLPFETLQRDDYDYLIEKFAFVYLQDVETLATDLVADGASGRGFDSLLSVGGVDYDHRNNESPDDAPLASIALSRVSARVPPESSGQPWTPLPATEGESRAVYQQHADSFENGLRTLLLGADATEERLKSDLPHHSLLHLATHGEFDIKGGERAIQEADQRIVRSHPGLLSKLVFAGANVEATDGDDGYLTAEEVSWLDLSGARLVVLSACQTGLGQAEQGEGLIGLRRAFRTAGANSVISSLWLVGDENTRDLMKSFYTNLLEHGMGTLEALRTAQLDKLREGKDFNGYATPPRKWGAFVVDGDWR